MAEQAKKPALEEMVKSIEKKLQGGATLSDALSSYPQSFDALYLSMVRAGETGGILDKIMERLSMIRESREELAGKVKGALIYPAFMFFAMAGCIVVLMAFVVPKFALMFADMGQALPLPTLILMNISKVFQRGWWAIPIVAAFAVYGFRKYTSTPNGRLKVDMLKLNSPAVGEFLLGISMARFCRIVGTLIRSGVPLLTALKSAKDVTGNLLIQKGIELTLTEIQDGKKLGIAMGDAGVFPRYVCDMAVMGEESGTLDNMLLKVAENY
ncbi:MAG: type II secretion system F family protein, partial [Desulfobacterales bacterium]|nr:type II secretion system F family protein [Desulfobacterales bacterium]